MGVHEYTRDPDPTKWAYYMLNNMQGACSVQRAVSKFNLYNMQRINLYCQSRRSPMGGRGRAQHSTERSLGNSIGQAGSQQGNPAKWRPNWFCSVLLALEFQFDHISYHTIARPCHIFIGSFTRTEILIIIFVSCW